jgi:guanylate kinase
MQPVSPGRNTRLLFVVSAPSGAGKTSLCRAAVQELAGLTFSVSHTTRPPRSDEVHGENYFFVTPGEFQQACERDEMAEWAEIYGNRYGTARKTIQDCFDRGLDILLDVDEQGARQLRTRYPGIITILVVPPSLQVLRQRLVNRGTDAPEAVQRRLARAAEEMRSMSWYRYAIVNDTFEEALELLKSVIRAERCADTPAAVERVVRGDTAG